MALRVRIGIHTRNNIVEFVYRNVPVLDGQSGNFVNEGELVIYEHGNVGRSIYRPPTKLCVDRDRWRGTSLIAPESMIVRLPL